ncbi:MAG TPA: hypothetical protein VMA73_04835 [Streptosporangiaceae bacterium]|nr:hypothetical protein [Streptosporangiaceae bacterium]
MARRWLGALVLVLAGLSVPIGVLARKPVDPLALLGILVAALGLLIARRQSGNRIALLLTGYGALLVFYENAARYAVADYNVHHGTLPLGFPAVLIASELWSGLFLMPPLIILLFPDGMLPPRWRIVARAYLAVCALIIAILLGNGAWAMRGAPIVVQKNGQLVNNPGPSGALGFVLVIAFLAVLVFWVLFVLRQVLSWRRATGERRAQLKWLMAGSVATVIGLLGTFLLQSFSGLLGALDNVMLGLGIFSLPVCITFAISKYHLYDIDRIISRTVAYAIVTGVLVGLYAGLVLLATRLLSFQTPVAVAASTLVAAALFNPLRHRVQLRVDRRFNRTRYDAEQMVDAFAARLKDTVDLESVRDDLAAAVHQALVPAHVSVWIKQDH